MKRAFLLFFRVRMNCHLRDARVLVDILQAQGCAQLGDEQLIGKQRQGREGPNSTFLAAVPFHEAGGLRNQQVMLQRRHLFVLIELPASVAISS